MVKQAIEIYNNERRHCSLNMKTPAYAHKHEEHKYKSYKKKNITETEKKHYISTVNVRMETSSAEVQLE